MAATGWLIRRRLRRGWVAMVPVALIIGLGAGGALVALGAAERTSHAYSRYLDRAEVGDVVINPSLLTADIDRVIRTLPGVRRVTSDAFFLATVDDGAPRTAIELNNDQPIQVRGSVDGRYSAMDRPALRQGRYPRGPAEGLVSAELARDRGIDVGDVVPVAFWSSADSDVVTFDRSAEAGDLSPMAVERVTVVGIATLADEVLPDGLYPRGRMIVSPDLAERYDCLPETPPRDASLEEAFEVLLREGCATSYQYYSLEVDGGAAGVASVLDAFVATGIELNAEFSPELAAEGVGYFLIATTTAQEQERVERSTRPTVVALAVLGGAAAVATAVVVGLAVARQLRRAERDHRQWWQLGLTTLERTRVAMAPVLAAVVAGVLVALALAWWLSPVGPVGSVRSVDANPARQVSSWVWLGALALAAALVAGALLLAVRAARRVARARVAGHDRVAVQRLLRGSTRPEVAEGVRAAYGGGSRLVVASGAVAASVFLTAVVFATSLSTLVSTPASYGWPWDLAMMGGFGYGGLDLDAAATTLDGRDDVGGWTGLAFTNDVALDGEALLSVVELDHSSEVDLVVVEGRLPAGADQVALGSRTAAERGIGVGDEVELEGDEMEPRMATVTGLVVFPALGPFLADRTAPGEGMLLPSPMFDPDLVADGISFIGIDLAPGADTAAVLAGLHDDFGSWDTNDYVPFEYGEPVLPAEIVNTRSMRTVPLLVGGLLGVATVLGLMLAVVASVRARRRELAILRAVGFTGRQVRRSVRAQAVAIMVAALAVGVPAGITLGRVAWRAFASQLGVVPDPSTPGRWIVATVAGALAVALVAAAAPVRLAGRAEPAAALAPE